MKEAASLPLSQLSTDTIHLSAKQTWALIPIKAHGEGKTRLASALAPSDREQLVEDMLAHVVSIVSSTISHTIILGPQRTNAPTNVERMEDQGRGLNAELTHAAQQIRNRPDAPDRLLIIHADLPHITRSDIMWLLRSPTENLTLAPDRHGVGTNAMILPLSRSQGFEFRYGLDSAAMHREMAEKLGLSVSTINTAGLEKDIDVPADLTDVQAMLRLTS